MTWSSLDLTAHCLADRKRTRTMIDALRSIVRPGHTVIDIGAGSGVLAFAALQLGAEEVIAVERDASVSAFLSWQLAQHRISITVLTGDAKIVPLPRADVIIIELIDTWLLEEEIVSVLASLRDRGVITDSTIIFPTGYLAFLEFGHTASWSHSLPYTWPAYEWPYYLEPEWSVARFTPAVLPIEIYSLSLQQPIPGTFEKEIDRLECRPAFSENSVNSVRLSGLVLLTDTASLKMTGALNAPILLPTAPYSPHELTAGVTVSGRFSSGITSLAISVGSRSITPWTVDE